VEPNLQSFIGCGAPYEAASAVVFGAPFDSTATFRPGARFGPAAVRCESIGIETYSPYQTSDLEDFRVFDAGDLELPFGNAQRAVGEIERFVKRLLGDKKTPCMIGGEHLATLGAVRAASAAYGDLRVIHFDAHADLRDDYMGEKFSHATVMRRVWELIGDGRIYQFGVRSGSRDELDWSDGHVTREFFHASSLPDAAEEIGERPVYVTLDLDVLDPSEFPGTGTPEAGGVRFTELVESLLDLRELDVKGFDICELAPHYDQSGRSTALACKILREMLIAFGA
jgi:agmatinase